MRYTKKGDAFGARKARYEAQVRDAMRNHLVHGRPAKPHVKCFAEHLGVTRSTLHGHGIDRAFLMECEREARLALGSDELASLAPPGVDRLKERLRASEEEVESLLVVITTMVINARRYGYDLDKLREPFPPAVRGGREGRRVLLERRDGNWER